jgi:hypothetical protein
MYNSKRKEEFIKDYLKSRVIQKTTLYALFKKTAQFEEDYNKDCAIFTKDEALKMFVEFKSKSIYVLLNNNTILKAYCAYMKYYHGLTTEIAYESITIDDLKPCVAESKNKLITREELLDIKNQLLNDVDKCILELLWEGVAGVGMCDITGLCEEQLDHKKKQLCFADGRVLNLTDELYNDIIAAFKQTEYLCYGESLRTKKLEGYGRLYKQRDNATGELDSEDRRFRWIYRKVQIFRDYVGMPWLTMKIIGNSGFAHYLQKGMEETGLEVKDFLKTDAGRELAYRYGYTSQHAIDNLTHKYKNYV